MMFANETLLLFFKVIITNFIFSIKLIQKKKKTKTKLNYTFVKNKILSPLSA